MGDLDPATKQRAEALALAACRELAAVAAELDPPQPTRVVWRTGDLDVPSAEALWEMGLALDAITADAVRIVVPPVGGV